MSTINILCSVKIEKDDILLTIDDKEYVVGKVSLLRFKFNSEEETLNYIVDLLKRAFKHPGIY